MSESLKIQHGDLALNGNSFATVSGGQKLVQDLRCALLTPLGFFEAYPTYGSSLAENITNSVIGEINWQRAATLAQAEINRICADYQRQQISRNNNDAIRFGKTTIAVDEMLLEVERAEFTQVEDNLLISITLRVGSGSFVFNIPVEGS